MSSLILSITKQLMKFNTDIDFSEIFINMSILLIEAKCPLVGRNIQQLKNRYLQEFPNTITSINLKNSVWLGDVVCIKHTHSKKIKWQLQSAATTIAIKISESEATIQPQEIQHKPLFLK